MAVSSGRRRWWPRASHGDQYAARLVTCAVLRRVAAVPLAKPAALIAVGEKGGRLVGAGVAGAEDVGVVGVVVRARLAFEVEPRVRRTEVDGRRGGTQVDVGRRGDELR